MAEQQTTSENSERTWARTRESRGGFGCCGCCLGALLIAGIAMLTGLSQLIAGVVRSLSGLDAERLAGLTVVLGLAVAAFALIAWRLRPRLKRTTTVMTRVSRAGTIRGANGNDDRAILDAPWRPAEPEEEHREEPDDTGEESQRPDRSEG